MTHTRLSALEEQLYEALAALVDNPNDPVALKRAIKVLQLVEKIETA